MSSLTAASSKRAKGSKKAAASSSSSASSSASGGRTRNRHDVKAAEVSHNVRDLDTPRADFLAHFRRNFSIHVVHATDEEIQFEMVGVDPAVANALRRILISEVPTVAIETVYLHNNTSIIQDEVLAHRLGLIPIDVEPDDFEDLPPPVDGEARRTDKNTLVFTLNVQCRAKPGSSASLIDPDYDDLEHGVVYSGDLVWNPKGQQSARFDSRKAPTVVHDDIVIAKLRPGQVIHLEAHCNRGVGKDHAKFSPVCTAAYRLMPEVTLVEGREVLNDRADKLMELMPGVWETEPLPGGRGGYRAVVAHPEKCTMSRNFMMEKDLAASVRVARVPDHFIFSVESVGAIPAPDLLRRALRILMAKCDKVTAAMGAAGEEDGASGSGGGSSGSDGDGGGGGRGGRDDDDDEE